MGKLIITENTEFTYWDNFDYQINDSVYLFLIMLKSIGLLMSY